jgi:hypothetical protein
MNGRAFRRMVLASLLAAAPVLAFAGGAIVITDHAMDPQSKTFEKDLKKAALTSLKPQGGAGHWHIYFVAYLNKAAGSTELNAVLYDLKAPKGEEPNAFPIQTQPTAKILMSDLDVSTEVGIKAGKYQMRITRLIEGKEIVYAKTNIELK